MTTIIQALFMVALIGLILGIFTHTAKELFEMWVIYKLTGKTPFDGDDDEPMPAH